MRRRSAAPQMHVVACFSGSAVSLCESLLLARRVDIKPTARQSSLLKVGRPTHENDLMLCRSVGIVRLCRMVLLGGFVGKDWRACLGSNSKRERQFGGPWHGCRRKMRRREAFPGLDRRFEAWRRSLSAGWMPVKGWLERVRGVRVALCHGNGLDGQRSLWDGDASAWSWW
jgi:hypothetical protein